MPSGYRLIKKDGSEVYTNGVPNLSLENMFPPPEKSGWFCSEANCNMNPMNLLPISRSKPAEFWECSRCKTQITMQERNEIFAAICSNIRHEYGLETFSYNRENNNWIIETEYEGKSRHIAKRKKITQGQKQSIIDKLLNTLEDTLSIKVQNVRDYWIE